LRSSPFDNFLYIGTGDVHRASEPQDLGTLGGKVLRVQRDGDAAPGNNAPGGDPRVYSYGHRNVKGLDFRPSSGQVFIAEPGPGHDDEVTPLANGGNGGWNPRPDLGVFCAEDYCYTSNKLLGGPTPMTDLDKYPDALRPSWNNGGQAQGLGPAAFLSGLQWGTWDGRLAVGFHDGARIDVLELDAAGTTTGVINLSSTPYNLPAESYRALMQGPDGNLYFATESGQIGRLVPD
jgi:glucose/arabinose dehydrogenase